MTVDTVSDNALLPNYAKDVRKPIFYLDGRIPERSVEVVDIHMGRLP